MSSNLEFDQAQMLPVLPAEWRWQSLQELVDPSRGICYGIVQPGNHDPDGIPMVNSGNVFNGRVALDVPFRVGVNLHMRYQRSILRGGEVLVTLVGANFGQVAIAPSEYAGHNCARPVGVVPVLESNRFVMYAMQSPLLRKRMDNVANTTAQPTLNLKDLGRLPIPIPPRRIREEIAEFLGAIDDRITLLSETNATLEAIAQALFKSWFVDFDPVRAKMAGRAPEGMDEATAALFPDAMEETELGLVPKGWSFGAVTALAVLNPESWSAKRHPERVLYVDLANTKDNQIEGLTEFGFDEAPSRARRILRLGDVIVGTVRPGNRSFAHVSIDSPLLTGSTGFAVLRAKEEFDQALVYLATTNDDAIDRLAHLADGGAYPAVRPEVVASTPLVIPPREVRETFGNLVNHLLASVGSNQEQCRYLADLRDTLLPRLISGQLRLPEARMVAEGAMAAPME